MRAVIAAMLVLIACDTGLGDDVKAVLSMDRTTWYQGEPIEFQVAFLNSGDQQAGLDVAEHVHCTLSLNDRTVEVRALLIAPQEAGTREMQMQTFLTCRYRFSPPESLRGMVRMRLVEFNTPPVMFMLSRQSARPSGDEGEADKGAVDRGQEPSAASLFMLYQPYLANISAYQPMYFLVGTEPEHSKFQISLKYRFVSDESPAGQKYPGLKGLYFGYTQTSFWDLKSASAPFEDTSYKPELFFASENMRFRPSWMKGLFIQAGAQHESNGRGGEESRSTNIVYARSSLVLYDNVSRYGVLVSPRVWFYAGNDDNTNPELEDYRGYFDLEVKVGKADSYVLGSVFRWARQGASTQLDFTYPLNKVFSNNLDIYLQAQYVDVLAESLLNYMERTQAFRIGFAIVR